MQIVVKAVLITLFYLAYVPVSCVLTNTAVGSLFLSGKVVNEKKRVLEAKIYIYKGGDIIDEFQTTRIGKLDYEMPMQDSVVSGVYAERYVSKMLIMTTKTHPTRQSIDHLFPFFMDLCPIGRVPAHIDLERPIGGIKYFGGQFI